MSRVTGFIAAFKSAPKPKKKLFFSAAKRKRKKQLQNAIGGVGDYSHGDANFTQARNEFAEIRQSDPGFAEELLDYKLYKHRKEPKEWTAYLLSAPVEMWTDEHRKELAKLGDYSWVQGATSNEIMGNLAQLEPDDAVELLVGQDCALLHQLARNGDPTQLLNMFQRVKGELFDKLDLHEADSDFCDARESDTFNLEEAKEAFDQFIEKDYAVAQLYIRDALANAKQEGDMVDWSKVFMAAEKVHQNTGIQVQQLKVDGDFAWVTTPKHAKELREFFNKQQPALKMFLLANSSIINNLEKSDPGEFKTFADGIPMLKAVIGARKTVDDEIKNLTGVKPTAGSPAYLELVAKAIFGSILGTGGAHSLTGFAYDPAAGFGPGATSMDNWLTGATGAAKFTGPCSVLTNIFAKLAETYPGPGKLRVQVHEIIDSVLTKELAGFDPNRIGYVTKGFKAGGGNVFENEAEINRIFFAGGSTGAAHTYISINGLKFDLLFGTVGTAVDDAVEDEFTQDPSDPDKYLGKTKKTWSLKRDRDQDNSGTAMGMSTYHLTTG